MKKIGVPRRGTVEWEIKQPQPYLLSDYGELVEQIAVIKNFCWIDVWAADVYKSVVQETFKVVLGESYTGRLTDVRYTIDGSDKGAKSYLHLCGSTHQLREIADAVMLLKGTPRPSYQGLKLFPRMHPQWMSDKELRISAWHFNTSVARLGIFISSPGGISRPRRAERRAAGLLVPGDEGTSGRVVVKNRLLVDAFEKDPQTMFQNLTKLWGPR